MPWNTPFTWVNGTVYGASAFNAQVRDNLAYLLSRPNARIRRTAGNYTISTTSFAAIDSTNLRITLSLSGTSVLVGFAGNWALGANGQILHLDLQVDTTLENNTSLGLTGLYNASGAAAGNQLAIAFVHLVTGLSVGSHTFTPFARVNTASPAGATLYASATSPLFFWALEIA